MLWEKDVFNQQECKNCLKLSLRLKFKLDRFLKLKIDFLNLKLIFIVKSEWGW